MIDSILGFVESVLTFLHDLFLPLFGANSWGWAIIALTLIVRVGLLPLAIKQTRSMRAMQAIQPQMKALQKKYKVDKDLMRKDPEQYRAKKAKLNEEMMALYKEEGANPAASCLPLLAQAPIFIALFYTLRQMTQLGEEGFYFLLTATDPAQADGLRTAVSATGWPGWLMILLMSGTMFLSQKQMMARNAGQMADSPMAQQQKILLYVMPIFLAVVSFQFPIGILLYWVTTNFWQVAQQAIILREVQHEAESGELADRPGGEAAKKRPRRGRGRTADDAAESAGQEPPRISPSASSGKSSGKGTGKTPGKTPGKATGKNGSGPTKDASRAPGTGSAKKRDAGPTRATGDDIPPTAGSPDDATAKDDARPRDVSGNGSGSADAPSSDSSGSEEARPTSSSRRDHLPRRGRPTG